MPCAHRMNLLILRYFPFEITFAHVCIHIEMFAVCVHCTESVLQTDAGNFSVDDLDKENNIIFK